jgi:hypothetical protein
MEEQEEELQRQRRELEELKRRRGEY